MRRAPPLPVGGAPCSRTARPAGIRTPASCFAARLSRAIATRAADRGSRAFGALVAPTLGTTTGAVTGGPAAVTPVPVPIAVAGAAIPAADQLGGDPRPFGPAGTHDLYPLRLGAALGSGRGDRDDDDPLQLEVGLRF